MSLITENLLDDWVRGHAVEAQGLIVELVWRLVAASSPQPTNRRFPLGDSIGQPGPDGELQTPFACEPFIPDGHSYWEIGTNLDAGAKATRDYRELTEAVPAHVRAESTFIFVTPLSGRRGWPSDWRGENQLVWIDTRQRRNEWADVRVIDGTKLVEWMHAMPVVELWLAKRLKLAVHQLELPGEHWEVISSGDGEPALAPATFLATRQDACDRLDQVLRGDVARLRLETAHPDQAVDFVSAYIASLEPERRADIAGRCVVISGGDAWTDFVAREQPHVLIAAPELDVASERGAMLLDKARRAGHRLVFSGSPGGVKDPFTVHLPNPPTYEIERTLREAGFPDERARVLARRSYGDLSSLVRCFKGSSALPAWASGPHAEDLAVAMLIGGWQEERADDIATVEAVSGRPYTEWVQVLRRATAEPGSPLTHRDRVWKFVARHDGWRALADHVYDSHLDAFKAASLVVLAEDDPALQLEKDRRYAAAVYGKAFSYSSTLREGIAETLALIGAQPSALTSCTVGRPSGIASQIVRTLLERASSSRWAGLNGVLPLLAEASPLSFLECVDSALGEKPSPFVGVFEEEDSGAFGRNYMTGLLWALETLAWEREHLGQVVSCLAELATLDPGGNWRNRPLNSLITIFLPWLPQTCAPFSSRLTAVTGLQQSFPDIGWKLLLGLLPTANVFSNGARKPTFRASIPETWSDSVGDTSFEEQTREYVRLTVDAAGSDGSKLADLAARIDSLPLPLWNDAASLFDSEEVRALDERARYELWKALQEMVGKHRQFPDAEWAMTSIQVGRLADIAATLAPRPPALRHLGLFDPNDPVTYQDGGDWHEHVRMLAERRRAAVRELLGQGHRVLVEFIAEVKSPGLLGAAWGEIGDTNDDRLILPAYLVNDVVSLRDGASSYVWARFRKGEWAWVDSLLLRDWSPEEAARLLISVPFSNEVWRRLDTLDPAVSTTYWATVGANADIEPDDLLSGAEQLLSNNRPFAAMRLLHRALHIGQEVSTSLLSEVFLSAISSAADFASIGGSDIGSLLGELQSRADADVEAVCRIEWEFLVLLDRDPRYKPVFLRRRMASDPECFCHFVRLAFHSTTGVAEDDHDADTDLKEAVASNAYQLLAGWNLCPGIGDDGQMQGAVFTKWLADVRRQCTESGHLDVAMSMLGKCVAYAPADQDGLWLDRTVANALNGRDAEAMRNGMVTEMFNSRGTYGFSGGAAELEIDKQYVDRATAIAEAGYPRLGQDILKLAQSYGNQAERDRLRGPYGT
ncbi:hypothetical protein [Paraburkholderia terrae]|uniref:Uncharacterized protein n=1 Tax=Paraburkholderia terrae TaxID=311230 RepID=A0A2I8EZF8_9BURK|nr:hypothetical protein [Paraburkholderia terrae]AUT64986.1 hypothetical protein C2L65_35945 [Paraburkholderia terrae]